MNSAHLTFILKIHLPNLDFIFGAIQIIAIPYLC